ncbi:hypothetical protein ACFXTI_037504 [Malus domestica]
MVSKLSSLHYLLKPYYRSTPSESTFFFTRHLAPAPHAKADYLVWQQVPPTNSVTNRKLSLPPTWSSLTPTSQPHNNILRVTHQPKVITSPSYTSIEEGHYSFLPCRFPRHTS